jgi:hypothetical protein
MVSRPEGWPQKAAKIRYMVAGIGCYSEKLVSDVATQWPASLIENLVATYPTHR